MRSVRPRVESAKARQILQRDSLDLDERTYIEIIRGKTAELCRVACALGAEYAGAEPATIERLGDYGYALEIAFQIADDYLDLWGDDDAVGKTLGTDLMQGKMTLPLIRLLQTTQGQDRQTIVEILRGRASDRLNAIRPWLRRSDARQYTRQQAEHFRQVAVTSLATLAESPAKACLVRLAEFSVDRHF